MQVDFTPHGCKATLQCSRSMELRLMSDLLSATTRLGREQQRSMPETPKLPPSESWKACSMPYGEGISCRIKRGRACSDNQRLPIIQLMRWTRRLWQTCPCQFQPVWNPQSQLGEVGPWLDPPMRSRSLSLGLWRKLTQQRASRMSRSPLQVRMQRVVQQMS